MFNFFTNLYMALFRGVYVDYPTANGTNFFSLLKITIENLFTFILNALGGDFAELQTFSIFENWGVSAAQLSNSLYGLTLIAMVLSLITLIIICIGVFKITKALFGVFFYGVR